jgi:hypothetical protein
MLRLNDKELKGIVGGEQPNVVEQLGDLLPVVFELAQKPDPTDLQVKLSGIYIEHFVLGAVPGGLG